MTTSIAKSLLEAYSRGEVTRKELQVQTDQPVSFGMLLRQLHEENLPLPTVAADPVKVQLVKNLLQQARPYAG